MTRDRLRQLLVLVGAIAQIAVSYYITQAGTDNFSRPAPGGDPPIIPAGYAFSIWGPIYAGVLAFAIYQLLPARRDDATLRTVGWGIGLGAIGATAWLLVSQNRSLIWVTVAILAAMAVVLGRSFVTLGRMRRQRGPVSWRERLLVDAPLGLFFGWASVAVFANIGSALRETGITQPGGETIITILFILTAFGIGVALIRKLPGTVWYAGTLCWAFIAIALANALGWRRAENLPVAIIAALACVMVIGAFWFSRRTA